MSERNQNLQSVLRRSFESNGNAQLIDGEGAMSFAAFDRLASSLAEALIRAGVASGDRIAVVAANSRWSSACYLGAWKAGAIPVGVNASLTAPELAYILGHSKPVAAMVDVVKLDEFRQANELAGNPVQHIFSDAEAEGATPMSSLPEADELWPTREYPDVAVLLYTSGTTGRPKGVMLTQANMLFMQETWRDLTKMQENDVSYCGLPLFHVYALVVVFLEALVTGHNIVLEKGFPFPRLLESLAEHRVSFFPAAPVLHRALAVLDWNPADYDLSSLRFILSGGAPVDETTVKIVCERLSCDEFHDGYGVTECGPIISFGPLGSKDAPGSAGKPVPGVDVEIRDADGKALGRNEIGEICVRSAGVMKGYYLDPEASAEVLVDGWYRTGDVGRIDDEGFIYVSDRIKDMVIVNGENVYPREVESALMEHSNIASAAVARMPSETTGETPLAFIVLKDASQPVKVPELLKFLRDRLAAYKLPGKFEFVDKLPTSAAGKILKRELHQ